ncbi:MAG: hypothetical protein DLM50_08310 [Candidatus Meridianibacter frigidus]|nr:MAG: hypothetical protein DLM50_08310 [Candidatus Eremiobacteraeota bacterium]
MLRAVFALIPALMLTLAVPLINRVEPHVFGLPFLLAWIVLWLLLTPLFLYAIYRMEGRT